MQTVGRKIPKHQAELRLRVLSTEECVVGCPLNGRVRVHRLIALLALRTGL